MPERGGWLPLWVCVVPVGEVEEVLSSFVRLQQAALNRIWPPVYVSGASVPDSSAN